MFTFSFSLIIAVASSQSTICVWNSIDGYDILNGEYTKTTQTHDSNPVWERYTPSTCAAAGYPGGYVFAAYYAADKFHYWTIHTTLDSTSLEVDYYPECGNDWTDFPSDPTKCLLGWQEWAADETYIELPLTVTDGECPVLSCPYIEITNSGVSECDKVYIKSSTNENVFVYAGTDSPKYLYFNIYHFKWYFSDTLGTDDCFANDTDITHQYLSSLNDKWKDVNVGETFSLKLSNENVATFSCTSTTRSPTKSPARSPTKSPVTMKPTEAPIYPGSPTKAPSLPTMAPTISPTEITDTPTESPSVQPTFEPTFVPTLEPTNVTATPTNKIWVDNNEVIDAVSERWRVMILSSCYTVTGWVCIVCLCLLYIYSYKKRVKQRNLEMMMNVPVASNSHKPVSMQSSFNSQYSVKKEIDVKRGIELQSAKRKKKKVRGFGLGAGGEKHVEANVVKRKMKQMLCQECQEYKFESEGKIDTDGCWYCNRCYMEFYGE